MKAVQKTLWERSPLIVKEVIVIGVLSLFLLGVNCIMKGGI